MGHPAGNIPDEYDAEAVERALEQKPSKRSKRVPWLEYDDLDDGDDPHPEWCGYPDQDAVLEAGRCAAPLRNSVRRYGELRYCTRLPARRMGKGNWQIGSDFCTHHCQLEGKAVPISEILEWSIQVGDLPYQTWRS